MILTDTGPLVALFDPADGDHARCKARLRSIDEALVTTVPVLTEAFHLLRPESPGARGLMTFVVDGGLGVWFLDTDSVIRSFELMDKYATSPMDLADASLVAAAERLGVQKDSLPWTARTSARIASGGATVTRRSRSSGSRGPELVAVPSVYLGEATFRYERVKTFLLECVK